MWPNGAKRENTSTRPNDFDLPFACLSAVAFTLGFLSLYLSLSVRHLISI
jgi:hypothetical protein